MPAEGVQAAVRLNHMGAAAVDAILVPAPCVHEGFDHYPEGGAAFEFEFFQDLSQWLGFAAAFDQVFNGVSHPILQKSL